MVRPGAHGTQDARAGKAGETSASSLKDKGRHHGRGEAIWRDIAERRTTEVRVTARAVHAGSTMVY